MFLENIDYIRFASSISIRCMPFIENYIDDVIKYVWIIVDFLIYTSMHTDELAVFHAHKCLTITLSNMRLSEAHNTTTQTRVERRRATSVQRPMR